MNRIQIHRERKINIKGMYILVSKVSVIRFVCR
jgi:hypothetical protein